MKFKRGVDATDVRHYVWFALGMAEAISRNAGVGEITVTSLRDGKHSPKSLHYKGLAADIRTRHMSLEERKDVFTQLRTWLDPLGFDTVLESDHIHTEYDPKPGEVFDKQVV